MLHHFDDLGEYADVLNQKLYFCKLHSVLLGLLYKYPAVLSHVYCNYFVAVDIPLHLQVSRHIESDEKLPLLFSAEARWDHTGNIHQDDL